MTSSSSDKPGEFELIGRLFAPLAVGAPGAFGLTDDAAVIVPPAGEELVVTTDALVEGVHFLRGDPASSIAKKSLRVNLSDLAAKGAKPISYLLALSLPDWPDLAWVEAFARGLGEDQHEFGISLIGGDTTRTPGPLTLAITALGSVPRGTMIRRAGAAVGDLVFVSGTIGDAGGGLAILKGDGASISAVARDALIARYREPSPRLSLGLRGLASAALDVSDGLLADLGHIADMSKVGRRRQGSDPCRDIRRRLRDRVHGAGEQQERDPEGRYGCERGGHGDRPGRGGRGHSIGGPGRLGDCRAPQGLCPFLSGNDPLGMICQRSRHARCPRFLPFRLPDGQPRAGDASGIDRGGSSEGARARRERGDALSDRAHGRGRQALRLCLCLQHDHRPVARRRS
jgi:thiamine-monophosphate kinase